MVDPSLTGGLVSLLWMKYVNAFTYRLEKYQQRQISKTTNFSTICIGAYRRSTVGQHKNQRHNREKHA